MKNELRKESFFNDLENVLEDIQLLLKDYGYDADDCMDDEDQCEADDEDMFKIISLYMQMQRVIDESR